MTGDANAMRTQWEADRNGGVAATCPSFDALSAYFDGELPEIEMRSIRTHVATCQNCAPIIADFRNINTSLNDLQSYELPRSFVLTDAILEKTQPVKPQAPVTPITRIVRRARTAPIYPIITALAALLLIAVIAGDAWSGSGHEANTAAGGSDTPRVLIIGGVPVEVDEDDNASFGAASAGAMNEGTASSDANAPAGSSQSWDWFNWWRPFELVLALTVVALIVTMLSRRRPRQL